MQVAEQGFGLYDMDQGKGGRSSRGSNKDWFREGSKEFAGGELTELEKIKPRIKNFNIAVKEFNDNIVFLRKLVKGGTNKSYGIQVARLAGIPDKVIMTAKQVLAGIEKTDMTGPAIESVKKQNRATRKKKKTANKNQMELFAPDEQAIRKILERTDVARITPIEAINLLNDLKTKVCPVV